MAWLCTLYFVLIEVLEPRLVAFGFQRVHLACMFSLSASAYYIGLWVINCMVFVSLSGS
jgi:hypothetical protein